MDLLQVLIKSKDIMLVANAMVPITLPATWVVVLTKSMNNKKKTNH